MKKKRVGENITNTEQHMRSRLEAAKKQLDEMEKTIAPYTKSRLVRQEVKEEWCDSF